MCAAPAARRGWGLILGGSSPRMSTYFLCFAKESRQRKATPGRPPVRRLRRRWSLALLENRGRHGMARRRRRRLAVADGGPPVFCDAQRALWGPNPVKRSGLRVLTGFGADLTSLHLCPHDFSHPYFHLHSVAHKTQCSGPGEVRGRRLYWYGQPRQEGFVSGAKSPAVPARPPWPYLRRAPGG